MSKFDQSWNTVDLQNECKRLKVPQERKNADLIKLL